MSEQTIVCPDCGKKIALSQALSHQLSEQVQEQLKQEKDKLQSQAKALEEKQKLQDELHKEQMEAKQAEWEKQLADEKKKLWAVAQQKALEKQQTELKDLHTQLDEQRKRLLAAEQQELELRRKARELEEKERRQELEMQRKLDEEKKRMYEQAKQEKDEEQRLKLAEKDKQMDILRKTIEDLKRQSEQGSMQIQGEVQENDLKLLLQSQFPRDIIEDVPTGINGADLIQHVNALVGKSVGTIIWESKNTKAFSEQWVSKLKADQALVKAHSAILVTQVLPVEVKSFAQYKGVWVTLPKYAAALATVLRIHLAELSQAKQALVGQDEKMALLYKYLTGAEFRNRVENMVIAFVQMREDLDAEKRSITRMWSKREKQIEKLVFGTSNMYGDLQGIIGGALPEIQQLELSDGERRDIGASNLFSGTDDTAE